MSLRTLAATAADASQACASGALALHPACWSADKEQPTLAPAGRACVQLAGKVEWCELCAREILGQRELSAWLQRKVEALRKLAGNFPCPSSKQHMINKRLVDYV